MYACWSEYQQLCSYRSHIPFLFLSLEYHQKGDRTEICLQVCVISGDSQVGSSSRGNGSRFQQDSGNQRWGTGGGGTGEGGGGGWCGGWGVPRPCHIGSPSSPGMLPWVLPFRPVPRFAIQLLAEPVPSPAGHPTEARRAPRRGPERHSVCLPGCREERCPLLAPFVLFRVCFLIQAHKAVAPVLLALLRCLFPLYSSLEEPQAWGWGLWAGHAAAELILREQGELPNLRQEKPSGIRLHIQEQKAQRPGDLQPFCGADRKWPRFYRPEQPCAAVWLSHTSTLHSTGGFTSLCHKLGLDWVAVQYLNIFIEINWCKMTMS